MNDVTLKKGSDGELEQIVDFADYVFSKAHSPHDFQTFLPKLYDNTANTEKYHFVLRENNNIMAVLCSYPTQLTVCGCHTIDCYGIGTVSAHPRAKGKGYMKQIMSAALEEMKDNNATISLLGGQRQRYEYFGYYPAGTAYVATLDSSNVKHAFSSLETLPCDLSFRNISDNHSLINSVYDIYSSQPIVCRPKQHFLKISSTWKAEIFAILLGENVVGYFIKKDDSFISELLLSDWSLLPHFLKKVIGKGQISIEAAPWEKEKISLLQDISENFYSKAIGLVKIMDYPKLISALLTLKAQYMNALDDTCVVQIDNTILTITLSDGQATVTQTPTATPVALFTHAEAAKVIFSYKGSMDINRNNALPQTWFPLPLYTCESDHI